MILVDSSVWIDHLRKGDDALRDYLEKNQVVTHPFIIGEIMLGSLSDRDMIADLLHNLPQAPVATDEEVLSFIEFSSLYSKGIGYIDAHLLASVKLKLGSTLWTRDKRLAKISLDMGLSFRWG